MISLWLTLLGKVAFSQSAGYEAIKSFLPENHWKRDSVGDKLDSAVKLGVSTSAFQIEGAWNVDGKGESIWDRFIHTAVDNEEMFETADDACESYKYPERDVANVKELGLSTYKVSISWPRIVPTGKVSDGINSLGLQYYSKLFNLLLEAGIEPVVTIFDWDLPQNLEEEYGGFLSRNIIPDFMEYANILFENFGGRVKTWFTINSPLDYCWPGYTNQTAPGVFRPLDGPYICGHNMLIAHAEIYQLYKLKYADQAGKIGLIVHGDWAEPRIWSKEEDLQAAWRHQQFQIGWFAHPIFVNGDYPEIMKTMIAEKRAELGRPTDLPEFTQDEMNLIKGSADFIGVNYWTGFLAHTDDGETITLNVTSAYFGDQDVVPVPDWRADINNYDDPVMAYGIRRLLKFIKEEYSNPQVIIAEMGTTYLATFNDVQRVSLLAAHLNQIARAMEEFNSPVQAIYMFSLMDNFEYTAGYTQKYGLFHTNFQSETKETTMKRSGQYIQEFVKDREFYPEKKNTLFGRFDDSFMFGAATSAFQHESAIRGWREWTVWDLMGIRGPQNSADILNHMDDDIKIIKELKLSHYSLTLSWARLFRYGFMESDVPDPDVIMIYRTYIQKLIAADIVPIVGLYDWDLPRNVSREFGGWTEQTGVDAFVRYADACFEHFGDLVTYWVTFQELQRELLYSYEYQATPPMTPIGLPGRMVYKVSKNMLLAHAQVYQNYQKLNLPGQVGLTLTADFAMPFNTNTAMFSSEDVLAAEKWNQFHINWVLEPLLTGNWPSVMTEQVPEARLPRFTSSEQDMLKNSVDFVGLMHKFYKVVSWKEQQTDIEAESYEHDVNVTEQNDWKARQTTNNNQRISKTATSVYELLKYVNQFMKNIGNQKPMIFMSGSAGESSATEDLQKRRQYVADTAMTSDHQKQTMTHSILNQVLKAIRQEKVNVIGYIHWSFIDGYEWITQYGESWGLVGVDWTKSSRDRKIKPFGYWFADLVEQKGFQDKDMICHAPLPSRDEIYEIEFDKKFIWATATAATQIEGGWNEDGKGESIWDFYSHQSPSPIKNNDTPDIACDSYHQMDRDISMLKELGLTHYRFSIAWTRIFPTGSGEVNQAGIDYYNTLIDNLLAAKIEPLVTMYHWDLPQAKHAEYNGWLDDTDTLVTDFVNYAEMLFQSIPKVKYWITFNEPYVFCFMGYSTGQMAPGLKQENYLQCGHNVIKANAQIYHLFKEKYENGSGAKIGITLNTNYAYSTHPQDPTEQHVAIGQKAQMLEWFTEPIFGSGDYSKATKGLAGNLTVLFPKIIIPEFTADEIEANKGTADFLGLNFYNGNLSPAIEAILGDPIYGELKSEVKELNEWVVCDNWWNGGSDWIYNTPWMLRFQMRDLYRTYGMPILITENGISELSDWLSDDNVDDWWRKRQIVEYIGQAARAMKEDNVELLGFTEWSLMDNFEWGSGYTEKFGLYRVDFNDPKRPTTPKESAQCYAKIIQEGKIAQTYEECAYAHYEPEVDNKLHPERDYIAKAAKMDYWERDQVLYGNLPKTFGVGAATASYQVEGGWDQDGKGPNIWDDWTHQEPCKVSNCDTGDVACDSYNNVERDVQLAKRLNLGYYRFSISWARVLPTGYVAGGINAPGIDYYNRLINGLLAEGIKPMVTLFHWDLPSQLNADFGGFNSSDIHEAFTDYANVCYNAFGDRVEHWFTFNEPHSYCWMGHDVGAFPPAMGDATGRNFYRCAHNMLLAHANAYRLYEKDYKNTQKGQVSITINAFWGEPKNAWSSDDIDAAQRYMVHQIAHWCDPLYYGDYPVEMKNQIARLSLAEGWSESRLPEFTPEEKVMIKGTLDHYSLQMYSSRIITTQEGFPGNSGNFTNPTDPIQQSHGATPTNPIQQEPHLDELAYWFRPGWYGDMEIWTATDQEWERGESVWLRHTPWGLRRMINWIDQRYPDSGGIWITENGISLVDEVSDVDRYQNIYQSFNEILKAIEIDNVKVHGTCIWSLMDNFEWTAGYKDSFGMYHVEFTETPTVTEKTSVDRMAALIANPVFVDPNAAEEQVEIGYFPEDFVWGVYSSAYETENRGNGRSDKTLWDTHHVNLDLKPDLLPIEIGDPNYWVPPIIASDAWVHINEDIQSIIDLGMKSYSLTISWTQVYPDGPTGRPNSPNLGQYLNILQTLKNNNIETVVSLSNWDLPDYYFQNGREGWASVVTRQGFVQFATFCYLQFGGLVDRWIPIENIERDVFLGYSNVNYPPASFGPENSSDRVFKALANIFEAHCDIYNLFKEQGATVGFQVQPLNYAVPANEFDEKDIEAAMRHNAFLTGSITNALMVGKWPEVVAAAYSTLPDISCMNGKYDFITISYETTGLVTFQDEVYNKGVSMLKDNADFWTLMGSQYSNYWFGQQGAAHAQRYYPAGFKTFIDEVVKPFGSKPKPIYMEIRWTTTGDYPAFPASVESNLLVGKNKYVGDKHQMKMFSTTINQVLRAIQSDSVPIKGLYFSLMDKHAFGGGTHYTDGLVKVDMSDPSRARSIKNSGYWLADLIEVNGFEKEKQNCEYNSKRDDTQGGEFPAGFQWSLATASYQIEGGWNEDGKNDSIWDTFTHLPPNPATGNCKIEFCNTGDVACDSYHKWQDDIEMIKALNIHEYRFSLSWSRLLPSGYPESLNQGGVTYYNNVINGLIANGIIPVVTLYHWDLPQIIQDLHNGWLDETGNTVDAFTQYADTVFGLFGDRVKEWITINEPWVISTEGHGTGEMAPGAFNQKYRAGHTLILAHSSAYRLYNAKYKDTQKGEIGITFSSGYAEGTNPSDPENWQSAWDSLDFELGWFAEPIFGSGDYPTVMRERLANSSLPRNFLPEFTEEEKVNNRGSDFFGLNHYTTHLSMPADTVEGHLNTGCINWPGSGSSWLKQVPWGFRKLLRYVKRRYDNPLIYVTENGVSNRTGTDMNLEDQFRSQFYQNYIGQMLRAINEDGARVEMYTAWSLMDNFEWAKGYTERFGLHYIDFNDPDRPRIRKDSSYCIQQIATENSVAANTKDEFYTCGSKYMTDKKTKKPIMIEEEIQEIKTEQVLEFASYNAEISSSDEVKEQVVEENNNSLSGGAIFGITAFCAAVAMLVGAVIIRRRRRAAQFDHIPMQ